MKVLFDLLGAPAKGQFILALSLSAVAGAAGVILLGLSGWFLTAAALAGAAGSGLVFNHLYPSAGVRGTAFTRVVARYAEQLVGHDATLKLSSRLRAQLFAAEAASQRGLTPMPAGSLATLLDDVDTVEGGFLRVLSPMAAVLASVIIALGYAFAANVAVGLFALGAVIFAGWIVPRAASRAAKKAVENLAASGEARRAEVSHFVENAIELDILGALPRLSGALNHRLAEHEDATDAIERPFRRIGAINGALGGALGFMLLGQSNGPVDIAIAAGGALALISAFDTLGAMAKALDAAPRAGAAAARVRDRLETPEAVPAPSAADALPLPTLLPITANRVLVRPAKDAAQIGPVTLTIQSGTVTFLKGPSGCGKTTLLETLARLHPVEGGQLDYAGTDWARCRTPSVLAHLAIAPQFAAFLPGSLREQFALAHPQVTDDAIWTALETAGLADTVRAKPGVLDTVLGEDFTGFSGGELRRLSLARALVTDAEVLALDEPFAGLEGDLATEIAQRLAKWAADGSKALVIAQHDPVDADWAPLKTQTIRLGAPNGKAAAKAMEAETA